MTTMRDQFATTANALLNEDGRTAIVLAEISLEHFRDALRDQPRRVVNVGIMEPAMVGIAAGFALEGFRPIVHTIEPFLTERALEQVKLDLANQKLPATLVTVGASYDYSTEGTTHHAPGAVQALLSIPGIEVYVPGAPREVDRLLRAAHASAAVSHVRTSVQTNREAREVEPGRLTVIRHGRAATVIAVGPMLDRTLEAVAGLDVGVLYATTIAPFDARGLHAMAGVAPLVIAVEPFHEGTLAFALTEALATGPRASSRSACRVRTSATTERLRTRSHPRSRHGRHPCPRRTLPARRHAPEDQPESPFPSTPPAPVCRPHPDR
jgi:transketolase